MELVEPMPTALNPIFRLRHEPLTLVVARADLQDALTLAPCAPQTLRMQRDRPLDVAVPFRIVETSRERDSYVVRLKTTLDGHQFPDKQKRWGDTWGWPHSLEGLVTQRLRPLPGHHVLHFHVEACHSRKPWRSREALGPMQTETIKGRVEVEVA